MKSNSMRRFLYRTERLFLLLLAMVVMVTLMSVWHLPHPVPMRHPGFDSSAIAPSTKKKKKNVCDGYDGVLHIRSGDAGAAAGTVFFTYVLNQLIYADKYNLLPWIHLNNVSKHVYDATVHDQGSSVSFEMLHGMTAKFVSDGYRRFGFGSYPGPPAPILDNYNLTLQEYQVTGTGVWNHYFQPVSEFDPSSVDCRSKPLIRLHYYHLNPAMLYYCPWSIKAWPYRDMRRTFQPETSLKEWYEPMRRQGHEMVQKYIRFQPPIVEHAQRLVGNDTTTSTDCLAMHVRHSDKGGTKRKKIPLESFMPYAEAYIQAGGQSIYLATDSIEVLEKIRKKWNAVSQRIIRQSDDIVRSSNRKAVFEIAESNHHRTNNEVLIDILAMSHCRFFVHGFSAVSEAVMYLNFELHKNGVNLEDHPKNHPMSPQEFEQLVRKEIKEK